MGKLCTKDVPLGPPTDTQTLEFDSGSDLWTLVTKPVVISAQISDTTTQAPGVTTPVEITLDTNDHIHGVTHSVSSNTADVIIQTAGTYVVIASPQITRTSGSMTRNIDFWLRVNDVDVVNSNVRVTLDKTADTDVILTQNFMDLEVDDVLNILMSISATGEGLGIAAITPSGEPAIPSIIFSMHKI